MDHEHTGEYVPKPGRMSRSREKQTHKGCSKIDRYKTMD